MKLTTIQSGYFKLDGGAMFGVVPKTLWNRIAPADENNLCTWSMRCLLIETGDRKILVDTGLGDKQDEKFRSHFEPHGAFSLEGSLAKEGLTPADITDVFITHHHFDHVGGAVKRDTSGELVPTFPNATYWSNESHFNWAYSPNPRERASFLKENFVPLRDNGVLQFIPEEQDIEWIPGIRIRFVYGHTEAMMLLDIDVEGQHVWYCADLIPSSGHLHIPYVMAYDVRPLNTLDEKSKFLAAAIERDDLLFFEHDRNIECGRIRWNDRKKVTLVEGMTLVEALS